MKRIYLDHNATVPTTEEHLLEVSKKIAEGAANPSSPHGLGRNASVLISSARKQVASLVDFDVAELVFTSGASEANNMGTAGVLRFKRSASPLHAITSAVEHPSIREPLEFLRRTQGLELTVLEVDGFGRFRTEDVISNIRPNTALIALMAANNEVGTVEPVREVGEWLHMRRWQKWPRTSGLDVAPHAFDALVASDVTPEHLQSLHFHVDGVQAAGKLPKQEWLSLGFDSVSLSAHKLGGLSGIGALALRRGRKFEPLIFGGAQEKNRRGGTENLVGIVSFGIVAHKASQTQWWTEIKKVEELRDALKQRLSRFSALRLTTPSAKSLPNTLNYVVEGVRSEDLLMQLDLSGICASSGSACSSGANLPSKILLAMGYSENDAKNALRITLGPENCDSDVDALEQTLTQIFAH